MTAAPRWVRIAVLASVVIGGVAALLYAWRGEALYLVLGAVAVAMLWAGTTATALLLRKMRQPR